MWCVRIVGLRVDSVEGPLRFQQHVERQISRSAEDFQVPRAELGARRPIIGTDRSLQKLR
jgi:hypothetical protein